LNAKADPSSSNNEDGNIPLAIAAEAGHADAVSTLVKSTRSIDHRNRLGRTAVSIAASGDSCDTLRALLQAKADVHLADHEGRTPLFWAAMMDRGSCIKVLVKHGADVGLGDDSHLPPLNCAAKRGNVETVEALLNSKASVNSVDVAGDTPLLSAVEYKHADVVTSLLEHKADTNQQNKAGIKPLTLSRQMRDRLVVNAFKLADVFESPTLSPIQKGCSPRSSTEQMREIATEDLREELEAIAAKESESGRSSPAGLNGGSAVEHRTRVNSASRPFLTDREQSSMGALPVHFTTPSDEHLLPASNLAVAKSGRRPRTSPVTSPVTSPSSRSAAARGGNRASNDQHLVEV